MESDSASEPYRVLGTINPLQGIDPKRVKVSAIAATIESDIRTFLMLAGFAVLEFNIRDPVKDSNFNGIQHDPHKDKRPSPLFAIWCSENPTTIQVDATGIYFQPQPFEVVLVNDALTTHHKPRNIRGRWFARASVEKRGIR